MLIPLLGIVVSLIFLITFAYRGHSVLVVAPLAALIAVLFSWGPLLASYTQVFMPALGNFVISFFPLFIAGAVFGRLMTVSGHAEDLARLIPRLLGARQAILATVLITALMTYGGISAWVIAFTIVPIAVPLFREANVSMRLMPAAIALGIFTFATAALPGSPQIHNAIPTRFFGTTVYAAPVLGVIGALVTFGLGYAWLRWRQGSMLRRGEGFTDISSGALGLAGGGPARTATGAADPEAAVGAAPAHPHPDTGVLARADAAAAVPFGTAVRSGLLGLLPILVVVVVNALFVYVISPAMDASYLQEERFGATTLSAVLGVWSVTVALVAAIVVVFLLRPRRAGEYVKALSEGARNSVLPVFTTASEVGYGAVIASLAVFAVVRDGLFGVSSNPAVVGAIATAAISGITGSSSGGLSITLSNFGEQLSQLAAQQGMSLELLHRVIAMASVSFDSLPHNGAIITLLLVCGLTHRQAYKDIGVVTVLVPLVGVLVVLGLGTAVPGLV
ncbi:GntP family permease [Micrococcus sp.]|uniref:GntP family permease n=1 Tax=Micrococcus sp. TaxID=1271 RepID=UPI0026DC04E2|nr:GntP family permease [Micrococcus sp.]MDO4238764.1 GntP family permease [Micrococcus sp.]